VAVTLDDAWAKLRRAEHHFETLRPEIEAFEQRDSHTFSYQVDADIGQYTFYVHDLEMVDPDWGLAIGDCLHNARTALDYLLVRLVAHVTGEDPREIKNVSFPIFDDPGDFASRVGSLRKKHPALHAYVTRIEELQPFNNGNVAIWGMNDFPSNARVARMALLPAALQRLTDLDNIDKHRIVHPAWVGAVFHAAPFPGIPADFRQQGASMGLGPFEDGAEVGSLRFETPLPQEWHPTQVDMKRHFALEVSFAQPLAVNGVLEVLPLCIWGVHNVLTLFDPVFTHGQPPLPVTTALAAENDYHGTKLNHLVSLGFGTTRGFPFRPRPDG
jgi:hypothetical protein